MPELFSTLYFDESGSINALDTNIQAAVSNGAKSILILACDENPYQPEDLLAVIQDLNLPIFGAVFPQIIHSNKNHSLGSIVCGLSTEVLTCEVSGLSDENTDFSEQIEQFSENIPDSSSLIVLVDGLSSCIATFLDDCYGTLGPDFSYIGGGAGSLSFEQKPCIFTNNGLRKDIAQIIAIDALMESSVEHGWDKLAGPFLVTSSSKNIIHALDYKPAFEVYKNEVEKESGETFNEDNFFDIAKKFPFGLSRASSQLIVRDPLKRAESDLVCVGEVPENNLIFILKGDADHLISASKNAASKLSDTENILNPALFIDCISRVLFLEERFTEELECVGEAFSERTDTIGALTLGEISDSEGSCIEFYNKTAVVGVFKNHKEQ